MFSKSSRSSSVASLSSNHAENEISRVNDDYGEDVPNTQYEDQNFRFTNGHPLGKIF